MMDYFKHLLTPKERDDDARYLPRLRSGEVEVARITNMAAVLRESIRLLARRNKQGRIRYRMADDYDVFYDLPIRSSRDALTLDEVIDQFVRTDPPAYDAVLVPFWESKFHPRIGFRAYKRGLIAEGYRIPESSAGSQ
jgi:hypothetical protein